MNDNHLLDCYITTRGFDFIHISFITLHEITHKIELKLVDDNSEEKQIEEKDNELITHSKILQTSNQSSKDCTYPFQQTIYFWYHKFNKLQSDRQYTLTLSSINNNNHDFKQIYCTNVNTLEKPKGKLLFRFGILADTHININSNNNNIAYGKRLYHKANELCCKYIDIIAKKHKSHFIIFPGDICDSGSKNELTLAKQLLFDNQSKIKCYPIIGNHESYATASPKLFYKTFNLGANGYYSFDICDKFHFIMISAPNQQDLNDDCQQFKWLCNELENNKNKICFIFTHYSFVLHDCVSGYKNDGMQQFYNHKNLLKLFEKYKKSLRVIFAGHKNVPSLKVKDNIYHLLCPQLIQSPCSYDIIDVYQDGIIRNLFEIEEKYLVYQSRVNCGQYDWNQRFGKYQDRNFYNKF